MKLKPIPLIALIAIFIASLFTITNHYQLLNIPETTLIVMRWLAIIALCAFGLQKNR